MPEMFILPFRPAFDGQRVVPGAQAWFTLEGTNTPAAIYSNSGLTIQRTNPVVADGIGMFPVTYIDPDVDYRVRIYHGTTDFGTTPPDDDPIEEYDPYLGGEALISYTSEETYYISAESQGAVGNGVTADQAAISSALALGNVRLSPGLIYAVSAPILIPSNRHLHLNGATIKMLAGFVSGTTGGFGVAAPVASINTTGARITGPGTITSNKVGLGLGVGVRKHGIMFGNATDFVVEDLTVKDCTGYACFAQGNGGATWATNGLFKKVTVYNSQYHFEQMQAKNITVEDCRSFDGDGDITCHGWLHPFFNSVGCENIHYHRHVGVGSCQSAIYLGAQATNPHRNITISDCREDNALAEGLGISTEGDAGTNGLRIVNCELNAPNGYGASFALVSNLAIANTRIQGGQRALIIGNTKGEVTGCRLVCTPATGVQAVPMANSVTLGGGTDSVSDVIVQGCRVEVTGDTGVYYQSGAGYRLYENDFYYNGTFEIPSYVVSGELSTLGGTYKWYHQNREYRMTAGEAQVVKLPNNTDMPWPVGTRLRFANPTDNAGSFSKTMSGDTGVTYTGPAMIAPWGFVDVVKTATNTWIGYGSGTSGGGAVTQATSRTTGVTLNKMSGAITLVSAAGSTSFASFTVTNSMVAATDTIVLSQKSGADKYHLNVTAVGAGSFEISFATISGTTTEQPVINFAVVKALAA